MLLGWWQDGINYDSTTYAVIARNLADGGNPFYLIFTKYFLMPFADHPPLAIWLNAVVFSFVGAADSTARIAGQLLTIGNILLVYSIARMYTIPARAFFSGLVLLLTYNFMQIGNSSLLEMPLTFFGLAAILLLLRVMLYHETRVGFFMVGIFLGLAWLSKGVVAAPFFIAIAVTVLLRRPQWLRTQPFWLMPLAAIFMIGGHLLVDFITTGGYFFERYFMVQIGRGIEGVGVANKAHWYDFTVRFAKMYLPFILLLPVGVYLGFRRRIIELLPIGVALGMFIVFYSLSNRLYYHYFYPAYALAAPLASLPIIIWLSDTVAKKIIPIFVVLWITTGLVLSILNVPIHHVRRPEVYEAREKITEYLESHSGGSDGLVIGQGDIDWDLVAKIAWYWQSDVLQVESLHEADSILTASSDFAYIVMKEKPDSAVVAKSGLDIFFSNSKLTVLTPAQQRSAD